MPSNHGSDTLGEAATEANMARYNGHKNYNAWNVALWLFNDESLYFTMKEVVKRHGNKDMAARELLTILPEKTPDGVKYSFTNIRLALTGDI